MERQTTEVDDATPQGGDRPAPTTRLTAGVLHLRPVEDADFVFCFALVAENPNEWLRLGARGATQLARIEHELWLGVSALFVVELTGIGPIGIIGAYDVDHRNRIGSLEAIAVPVLPDLAPMEDAMVLALQHAFRAWNLRKVYVPRAEYQRSRLASLASIVHVEAELRDDLFHDDMWWNTLVECVYRDEFLSIVPDLLDRIERRTSEGA